MKQYEYFHYAGIWIAISALNRKAGDNLWASIYFGFGVLFILIGIVEAKP